MVDGMALDNRMVALPEGVTTKPETFRAASTRHKEEENFIVSVCMTGFNSCSDKFLTLEESLSVQCNDDGFMGSRVRFLFSLMG